jgi:hypothetical protein
MENPKQTTEEFVTLLITNELSLHFEVDAEVVSLLAARVLQSLHNDPLNSSMHIKARIRSAIRLHYAVLSEVGYIRMTESKRLIVQPQGTNNKESLEVVQPPLDAEFLLHLLLRGEEQEAFIGCLVERYGRKVERFGKHRADIWFYLEVIRSACPLVRRFVAKTIKFMILGEWIRRMIQ